MKHTNSNQAPPFQIPEGIGTVLNQDLIQQLGPGIRSTDVRIGGYSGCYRIPHMDTDDPEEQTSLTAFADEFEDTDRFKLLLDHIPLIWLDWDYRDRFPVDLVLSGHYHGGIVRHADSMNKS